MPTALSWSDAKRRAQNEFDERCKVAFQPNIPLWAEHRGVTLCNAARLPELDFSNALAEFKEQVNVRHWRNVEQRTVHAISRIAAAIGLWITLIGAYYVARWVYRGDPKGQDTGA